MEEEEEDLAPLVGGAAAKALQEEKETRARGKKEAEAKSAAATAKAMEEAGQTWTLPCLKVGLELRPCEGCSRVTQP